MQIAVLGCRILFFVTILGLMTESVYSQKLLKKVDPIPQDQKDFITKLQLAMINLKSAEFINNPVAKKEVEDKAIKELNSIKGSLKETIEREGLTDWIAFCSVESSRLLITFEILVQNPSAKKTPNSIIRQSDLLSQKFYYEISLREKGEIDSEILETIKRMRLKQHIVFSLSKTDLKETRDVSLGRVYIVPSKALTKIAVIKN